MAATDRKPCSLGGATSAEYLRIALDAVKHGQWKAVAANAAEAAKYAEIEDRIGAALNTDKGQP